MHDVSKRWMSPVCHVVLIGYRNREQTALVSLNIRTFTSQCYFTFFLFFYFDFHAVSNPP